MGLTVGLVDADVYGHSIPRMLNADEPPTMVEGMIMPPQAYGVRVISMLPFKPGGVSQPVAFRGPMLHRALQQFLADVWWGDLDVLLLDLPPGTGDVAISTAQLLPNAEIVVVTTPQSAAADVAVRAGTLAAADAPEGRRRRREHELVPRARTAASRSTCSGWAAARSVAETLSRELGTDVPLLGPDPVRRGPARGRRLPAARSC